MNDQGRSRVYALFLVYSRAFWGYLTELSTWKENCYKASDQEAGAIGHTMPEDGAV